MKTRNSVKAHPVLLTVLLALLALAGASRIQAQSDPTLCVPPNFFVSTFVETFYLNLLPPVGFCIVDNGSGDLNPALGTIEFNQNAGSSSLGVRNFQGTAQILPGSVVVGGANGFGLRLTNFRETVLATGSAGFPVLPIFVQNTFTPGIPAGVPAVIITNINGFTAGLAPEHFVIGDLGSWAGVPVVSSGHLLIANYPYTINPPAIASPPALGNRAQEVVTLQYLSTTRQAGGAIILPTSLEGTVQMLPAGTPVPGMSIQLRPLVAVNVVGTQHTVTATLDPPQQDVNVTFTVTGPNAQVGAATTDANGVATFTYVGNNLGTDFLTASVGNVSSNQVAKDWIDPVPPKCQMAGSGINAQGKKFILIAIEDDESGLDRYNVLLQENSNITSPGFTPGTRDPVYITATKLDSLQPSRVELEVFDLAGNRTPCDPVLVGVSRRAGEPEDHTFSGIPAAEHRISVWNGAPGLTELTVEVNGRRYSLAGLKPGELRELDVAGAMEPGDGNVVILTAHGRPGGEAAVLLHD
jgi:hypothetical protein